MKLINQKALNLTSDGVARTIVCWYAKGGRTNLADWKGDGHFAMTSVLEEWDDDEKEILVFDDYNGRLLPSNKIIGTLTRNCGNSAFRNGWKIIEVYEDNNTK